MKILAGSIVIMLIGFIFVIVGVQALARIRTEAPDPFFSNADRYIGQPVSAIEAYGFSCSAIDDPQSLHCISEAVSDTFSEIRVVSSAGITSEIAFSMQKDAIRIGNLLLTWGAPEIHRYNQSIRFYWRGGRIVAVALRETGLYSPSLPVWKVYFLGESAQV